MTPRRDRLLDYFRMVAWDLVSSGTVARQQGQSFDDILRTHPRLLLAEVQADVVAVGRELGVGLALGLGVMLENGIGGPAGKMAHVAGQWLADAIAGTGKKR